MTSQFYMTLPSNSVTSNSAAAFLTSLPVNINLDGEWEVGLAEIIYGNTWFNVTEANRTISFYHRVLDLYISVYIATGRYETTAGLLDSIVTAFDEKSKIHQVDLGRKIYFAYNENIKRCQMMIDTDEIQNLKISKDITYMLGFGFKQISEITHKKGKKTIYSHFPTDLSCSLNHLYIYCDILKPQIVGNVLAPLLQIVSIQGAYTDTVNRLYITPHYVPVLKKSFASIEINIKDDQGQPIKFEYGKTIVKLHFWKTV